MTTTDRIEKKVVLRAPRSKVWRALSDAKAFGTWFGATFGSDFAVGRRVAGKITTPGYDHLTLEMTIERMDPETLLSFWWHPGAPEPESGFDRLPPSRRDEAFRSNDQGWAEQLTNIRRHVDG